jgi:hypothetical protein
VAFAEPLDVMFRDFGEPVVVDGMTLRGIFDEPGALAFAGGMTAAEPQLQLPTASVPADLVGRTVSVHGRGRYTVLEHVPDGTGLSTLRLGRA